MLMNEALLEKMGGERICRICGYVEREVYRLFCPRCMQRDRLSSLVAAVDTYSIAPYPMDPPPVNPVQGVSM
jgi:hypothetical protein